MTTTLIHILKRAQLETIARDESDYNDLIASCALNELAPPNDIYAFCEIAGRVSLHKAGRVDPAKMPLFRFRTTPYGWTPAGLWVEDEE